MNIRMSSKGNIMAAERKIPLRQCVGCGEDKEKSNAACYKDK